jgi:hypothetical protein
VTGKTPSGIEIRGHLRRLVRSHPAALAADPDHHPRRRLLRPPRGHGVVRQNAVDFIFGLPGNAVLDRLVDEIADDIRTRRALDQKPCLRGFAETTYQAKSWNTDRRACARIEATTKGLDIRFVVTSIGIGSVEHIYETLYCARGQAENPGLRYYSPEGYLQLDTHALKGLAQDVVRFFPEGKPFAEWILDAPTTLADDEDDNPTPRPSCRLPGSPALRRAGLSVERAVRGQASGSL